MLEKVAKNVLIAFITIMFLLGFVPVLESQISSATITNDFLASMIDMSAWVVPGVGIIAVILGVLALLRRGRGE